MELNTWICTDDDTYQHCKRVGDYEFWFIEANPSSYSDSGYIVFHDVVDLQDYTLDKLQGICHAFYDGPADDSIREIINTYGTMNAMQIIAECCFESIMYYNMEFTVERNTFEEAKQFIDEWMEEN